MDVSPVKMYTYSKGFYLGISLEGSVFWQREEANEMFYRHPYTAEELLFGSVRAPRAAEPLYDALWEAENGQVPRDKHEPTRQDDDEPVQAVVTGPGTALAGEGQHSEESHEGFHNSTDWEDITDIGVDGPEVLPPSTGRRGRPGLLLESSNQTLGG